MVRGQCSVSPTYPGKPRRPTGQNGSLDALGSRPGWLASGPEGSEELGGRAVSGLFGKWVGPGGSVAVGEARRGP